LENIDVAHGRPSSPQRHYWRADLLGGLEMFCADFTTQRFSRHWHPGYALGVVTRGAERLYCRAANHVAGTGELVAVNPGEIHDGEPAEAGGWAYRMLYPSERLVREVWSDLAGGRGTPRFRQSVITDGDAARQLVIAHRAAETAGDRLQAESALVLALSTLLARHAEPEGGRRRPMAGADEHRLRPALELIEADVARPLSLDELAAAVGLGRFHFLRLFKASLGCPPHHYLVQRRVACAKALLEDGLSPAQAGVASGFFDQSHFANAFRRTYGMTPRAYQRGRGLPLTPPRRRRDARRPVRPETADQARSP
jgi:AraC-like DNA-binding protein